MKTHHRLKQNVVVYSNADASSQVIAEFNVGDTITVDESAAGDGKWDAVILSDGTIGYISGKTKAKRLRMPPGFEHQKPAGSPVPAVIAPSPSSAIIWPSKGVWVWAGMLATMFTEFKTIGPASALAFSLAIILAFCAWWYSESKRRYRRKFIFRFLGYLTFGVGSIFLIRGALLLTFLMGEFGGVSLVVPILRIVFGSAMMLAASFFVFIRGTGPDARL